MKWDFITLHLGLMNQGGMYYKGNWHVERGSGCSSVVPSGTLERGKHARGKSSRLGKEKQTSLLLLAIQRRTPMNKEQFAGLCLRCLGAASGQTFPKGFFFSVWHKVKIFMTAELK